MLHNNKMICILLLFFVSLVKGQQFYDPTSCIEGGYAPGTRYTCTNTTSIKVSCQTFLIFRANNRFLTVFAISTLFGSPPDDLLKLNQIDSASEILISDREILIPVRCSCLGNFFQAKINYTVTENTTLSETACGDYEGLVKTITLLEENQSQEDIIKVGYVLNVPLKCACPTNRYKYLVTYPLVLGDSVNEVSRKFNISMDDILVVNNLHHDTTIYPYTTILVPLNSEPKINFDVSNLQPPTPGFLPTKPIQKNFKTLKLKYIYIVVSIIGFTLVLVILVVSGLYIKALNKCKREIFVIASTQRSSFASFSTPQVGSPRSGLSPITRSTPSSCLSPDLLVGIKYSLYSFTIEEIKRATKDFCKDCKMSENVYKGSLDDVQVLIKEIELSEIRHVIDIHSKINHVNIVKLLGACYNELSWSYLVMEHPTNGSLRDCLSNPSSFTWHRRTQVAFDVAVGLHYLHYCIVPPYMQTGLNSQKIFVTSKWRAKLTVLERNMNPGIIGSSNSGYETFDALKALEKEDILEFGIVLLEILSGKKKIEGKLLRESIGFLGGDGSEGGCFEKLRIFMDPCLKEDYPLAEALCLGVLAKACVECDPLHRPSMDDILKVLARMV